MPVPVHRKRLNQAIQQLELAIAHADDGETQNAADCATEAIRLLEEAYQCRLETQHEARNEPR